MTSRGYVLDCAPASQEFAPFERIQADVPQKGASSLFVGPKMPPLGLCWLGSDTIMPGGGSFAPNGELVRIRMRRNGRVYFDRPLQRTWHGPAVIPLGVPILEDVVLDGGKGPIHVGLADRVTIRNWVCDGYDIPRAISVQSCRNVQIQNVSVSNPSQTGPGQGYGVQIQRCVSAGISGLTGNENRHLATLFAVGGASVRSSQATSQSGTGFDCHFSCEDILFEDCDSGLSDVSLGNKWAWGVRNVTVRRMKNAKMLWLHGDASVIVEDSKFLGPLGLMRNAYSGPQEAILRGSTSFGRYSQGSWLHMEGNGPFDTRIVMEGLEPTAQPT